MLGSCIRISFYKEIGRTGALSSLEQGMTYLGAHLHTQLDQIIERVLSSAIT